MLPQISEVIHREMAYMPTGNLTLYRGLRAALFFVFHFRINRLQHMAINIIKYNSRVLYGFSIIGAVGFLSPLSAEILKVVTCRGYYVYA